MQGSGCILILLACAPALKQKKSCEVDPECLPRNRLAGLRFVAESDCDFVLENARVVRRARRQASSQYALLFHSLSRPN